MCLYANNSCSADSRQKHLDAANRASDKKSRTDDFEQEVWIEEVLLTYYRIWGNIGRGERIRTSDHLNPIPLCLAGSFLHQQLAAPALCHFESQ